jgi:hypothetical protein
MQSQNNNLDVVWQPIPNSSQSLALDTRCHHTLYAGTRGPGKSATQLMRYRRRVGLGYGAFWRGVIFDVEFKNLGDIVAQSKKFFPKFNDGCKFLESAQEYKWKWPTGEELLFRHAKKLSDYEDFHGWELPFIGFNELTKWPNLDFYNKIMSTNRSSFIPELHTPKRYNNSGKPIKNADGSFVFDTPDGHALPPIPLEVFSTTNPSGIGHNAVKRRFINVAPYGQVVRVDVDVFDPQTQQDTTVTKTQVTIFGSYRENIYLSAEYIAELDLSTRNDANLAKAWLEGCWDVTAGGALDDLWDTRRHVLPRFRAPPGWRIDRSFDWGSSHPFAVCWWVEANGEEARLPDGRVFCPPVGTLIQIAELYGTAEIGTNKGLRLSASHIASKVKQIDTELFDAKWIRTRVLPGPADNQIRDVREEDVDTIEKKMSDKGIHWEKSDKSPGSRKIGLELVRESLAAVISDDRSVPHLYFMQNCRASIETLPSLPRDEKNIDDVDTSSEDHIYDAVRYRVLKGRNRYARLLNARQPT